MAQVARLWNAPAGSKDALCLESWGLLIDRYEARTARTTGADPVEIIKAYMEMTARTRGEFARIVGQNRATEILARRRPLTLDMIRAIAAAWDIPADLLIAPYDTAGRKAADQPVHA